jgi:hypothetical protein
MNIVARYERRFCNYKLFFKKNKTEGKMSMQKKKPCKKTVSAKNPLRTRPIMLANRVVVQSSTGRMYHIVGVHPTKDWLVAIVPAGIKNANFQWKAPEKIATGIPTAAYFAAKPLAA